MLGGDLPAVAVASLKALYPAEPPRWTTSPCGSAGRLRRCLAQTAISVADALERHGGTGNFRGKTRRRASADSPGRRCVTVYTRSLDTSRAAARVVEATLALPVSTSSPTLRPSRCGRTTGASVSGHRSRFGRSVDVASAQAAQPLSVSSRYLALRRPGPARRIDHRKAGALDALAPAQRRVDRLITSIQCSGRFLDATLAAATKGHGQGADRPTRRATRSRLAEGQTGAHLDLVVLAVEWGSGDAAESFPIFTWARGDPASGEFIMVGKTFKGMKTPCWSGQTVRLPNSPWPAPMVTWSCCAPSRWSRWRWTGYKVVAYPGGLALRFARSCGTAMTKAPRGDTIDAVRLLY